MQRIASLILLSATLSCTVAVSGCGPSEAERAQERQAAQAAEEARLQAERLAHAQEAIRRVIHDASLTGDQDVQSHVDSLRSINISDSPPEFQQAFNKYVRAWDEAVQVRLAKEKEDADEGGAAVGGFLASTFGSDSTPWADHVAAEQRIAQLKALANNDIHSSYEDMRDIASKYGIQIG